MFTEFPINYSDTNENDDLILSSSKSRISLPLLSSHDLFMSFIKPRRLLQRRQYYL